jgi:hypothetical protein
MWAWLGAFAFTQAVECPIYVYALGEARPRRSRAGRAAVAFGASAITHPVVWFLFPWLWIRLGYPGGYWTMVAFAEAFAVLVEAAYVWGFGLSAALGWAVVANAASLGLGLLLRSAFGWP